MTRLRDLARFAWLSLAIVGLAGCAHDAPEEVDSETVVPVTTVPAEVGNIRARLHVTGTVTAAPGAELVVVAPEPARIAAIPKAEGEMVARGDVLVRFEIPNTAAEVPKQRAEMDRAQAQIDNAKAAQVRAKDLFDRGIAARKEVEDTDRDLAEAQAALAQAQAALAAAEAGAARATVVAPFSGVIAKRMHNPGDQVEGGASDPVLRLIDPRRLEVTASIPIADVARVVVGSAARTTGSVEIALKVASRPAAVEEGTATVPIRLAFTTPTATFPVGAPVQLDIDAEEHQKVVLVPAVAIVREAEETAVFVVADKKAQRRPVTIGIVDQEHAEVQSGIKPGEAVITHGQAGLPDGAAVTLESDAK